MDWEFDTSLGNERINSLKDAPSFEEITARIKNEMKVSCFHTDDCKDSEPFKRAVYCIKVRKKLFDWFFNSESGYRAAYFRSPCDGLKANEDFILSLIPELLRSNKTPSKSDKLFIEESLKSPSAKVWLVEENGLECGFCAAEWKNPPVKDEDKVEIANNKWEQTVNHNYGRKAPELTKIRIVGAFLNKHYDVLIPERKRFRSEEIHDKGWT